MIIGIDGNEANVKSQVGVSVYTLSLLKEFQKQSGPKLSFKVFLKNPAQNHLPKENKYYQYEVVHGKRLWVQMYLPLRLYLKRDVDVFFSPAHYAPRFSPVPTVVTVHDLAYFYFKNDFLKKDLYQLENWTKYSVKNAKKIIAVSKTTKKDLVNFYHLPEDRIEVIYNGYEKNIKKEKGKIPKTPYILFVGTIQPRKNITTLIDAFSKFYNQHKEFKLMIVGKKGWLYEDIFNYAKSLGVNKRIIFTGHITDNKLVSFYKNAFCLVIPSFYEGFGIPLLEALSYNCPVISSYASSLPEIGGDSCLYFDPKSADELLEKLELLKNDSTLKDKLNERGKNQLKQFSWKKCARETLETIKKAYEH